MRRALVVGIDNYPDAPLSGCVNDANAMAAVLETNGDGSPNFAVKLITAPSADVTTVLLRHEIETLFATECDIAVLYFSGHGHIRAADGHIVTRDAKQYAEGVSMTEVLAQANNSPVKNKVIILDCCFSGNFGVPNVGAETRAQLSEGLTVLTASLAAQPSFEIGGGGVFTSLVVDALQGGAADLRGHITPGSIYAFVDQALGAWDQRPIFRTNVSQFTSLREVPPQVPLSVLRKLTEYFPSPEHRFPLDPSYEDQEEGHDPEHVAIFKDLQKMQSVGLVVPVDAEFMYFAAINSKSCRLTAMGSQYWRLANEKKL